LIFHVQVGTPLLFETIAAILSLVAFFFNFKATDPSVSSKYFSFTAKKIPHTFTLVTIFFAMLVWTDVIPHLAGVVDDGLLRVKDPKVYHPVDFMSPLLYLGAVGIHCNLLSSLLSNYMHTNANTTIPYP
jgi:hypothetical protein